MVIEYEKFMDMVSDIIPQLIFKEMPLIGF